MSEREFKRTILVVEDDKVLNALIAKELAAMNYHVEHRNTWRDTETYLAQNEPDLIILDIRLPDADGMELLELLAAEYPVIILTAFGSIEQAVKAIKAGAVEYLSKPINLDELEMEVGRALENAELRRNYQFVRDRERAGGKSFMVGKSKALHEVVSLVDAVAATDATVLIQGESGVGKELVAQEIHQQSPRRGRNFVAVDCCTLHENLFESELFGHERGSFTGATTQKRGLIEGANGGTLFLDEIGEISAAAQAKLLRVIETGQFRRLGGVKDLTSNTRIVVATNRDLAELSRGDGFRSDLYYRLSTFVIWVPPLRDRREDIPVLAQQFLANHDFSRRIAKELSPQTIKALVAYDWPGNIRELRNVMERAIIVSGSDSVIRPGHLGLATDRQTGDGHVELSFDHEPTLDEIKKSYIDRLLKKYSGRKAKIAASLGISERNVYRLLKKYGAGQSGE